MWDSEWEGRSLPAYSAGRSRALLPVSHTSLCDILSYSELLHYFCSYRVIRGKVFLGHIQQHQHS